MSTKSKHGSVSDAILQHFVQGKLEPASSAKLAKMILRDPLLQARVASMGDCEQLSTMLLSPQTHNAVVDVPLGIETSEPEVPSIEHPACLEKLRQYQIVREIGRGGTSNVFLAKNKLLKRDEVLKVLSPARVHDEKVQNAFRQEVKATARLNHPSIVTSFGVLAVEGQLVLILEYLSGSSLAEHLDANPRMPIEWACYFSSLIASALQHAHEKRLVHGDVKPHNLMMIGGNDERRVKLIDFGLVRCLDVPSTPQVEEAGVGGTPAYMSPEQVLDPSSIDQRSDIYSLGCTLFHMLDGAPPYSGNANQIMLAQAEETFPSVGRRRQDIPRELVQIIAKMTARDAANRFQSAHEVCHALRPFLSEYADRLKTYGPVSASKQATIATDLEPTINLHEDVLETASIFDTDWTDLSTTAPTLAPTVSRKKKSSHVVWYAIGSVFAALLLLVVLLLSLITADSSPGKLQLENLPGDAIVLVDGTPMAVLRDAGALNAMLSMPAGKYQVEIQANSKVLFSNSLELLAGSATLVRIEPVPIMEIAPIAETAVESTPVDRSRAASIVRGTPWQSQGEELVHVGGFGEQWLLFGDETWSDYTYSFEFQGDSVPLRQSAIVRAVGAEKSVHWGTGWKSGVAVLESSEPLQPFAELAPEKAIPSLEPNRWYRYRTVVRGSHIECFLDDAVIWSADNVPHDKGRVGIRIWSPGAESTFRARDFRVEDQNGAPLWEGLPETSTNELQTWEEARRELLAAFTREIADVEDKLGFDFDGRKSIASLKWERANFQAAGFIPFSNRMHSATDQYLHRLKSLHVSSKDPIGSNETDPAAVNSIAPIIVSRLRCQFRNSPGSFIWTLYSNGKAESSEASVDGASWSFQGNTVAIKLRDTKVVDRFIIDPLTPNAKGDSLGCQGPMYRKYEATPFLEVAIEETIAQNDETEPPTNADKAEPGTGIEEKELTKYFKTGSEWYSRSDYPRITVLANDGKQAKIRIQHISAPTRELEGTIGPNFVAFKHLDRVFPHELVGSFSREAGSIKLQVVSKNISSAGTVEEMTFWLRPLEAEKFQNHYYYTFAEPLGWFEAKKRCEYLGGSLATSHNPEVTQFLAEKIAESQLPGAWLGGSNRYVGKDWKWNTIGLIEAAHWGPGSDPTSKQKQHLAIMPDGKWAALSPDRRLSAEKPSLEIGYICQWDVRENSGPARTLETNKLPLYWEPLLEDDSLADWRQLPGAGNWQMRDGELVGTGVSRALVTRRHDFQEFHLRMDVWLSANAKAALYTNIQSLSDAAGEGAPIALESLPHAKALLELGVDPAADTIGSFYRKEANGNELTVRQQRKMRFAPDCWHKFELIQGRHGYLIKMDDVIVASLFHQIPFPDGQIGFQNLAPNSGDVKIRNLEILEAGRRNAGYGSAHKLFDGNDVLQWICDPAVADQWRLHEKDLVGRGAEDEKTALKELPLQLRTKREDFRNFAMTMRMTLGKGTRCGIVLKRADGGLIEIVLRPNDQFGQLLHWPAGATVGKPIGDQHKMSVPVDLEFELHLTVSQGYVGSAIFPVGSATSMTGSQGQVGVGETPIAIWMHAPSGGRVYIHEIRMNELVDVP